ncbi:hypothetical protein VTK73DRAFT_4292 [Phialemonium thermophilum]|uniref:HECT-type E3 ubiquitin transferase n=1 Tax=Phialemonium thermophilum TaxID=223376 RepID=A0ABR3WU04_9PEZI
MFPTFTGNSRKPRNVNLSGQPNVNPFTAKSWVPGSSAGPSKIIADAQAERRHRQQERERRQAAQRIQRVWRGHRVRRHLAESRRKEFDELYGAEPLVGVEERLLKGLALVLAFFNACRSDDLARLDYVVSDLSQTSSFWSPNQRDSWKLAKLALVLLEALEKNVQNGALTMAPRYETYLTTLDSIIKTRPQLVRTALDRYYDCLAGYCREPSANPQVSRLLLGAVVTPLQQGSESDAFTRDAYRVFAFSFLSRRDLALFENLISSVSKQINMIRLSEAIADAHAESTSSTGSSDDRLWLLAHFIALQRESDEQQFHPAFLRALYVPLSSLSNIIRSAFSAQSAAKPSQKSLPAYVVENLGSLVNKKEISGLLERFSSSAIAEVDSANLLAGYTLTLLRCFPAHSDDIRMQLYLADMAVPSGRLPAVKFFWRAMNESTVFSAISSSESAALELLKQGRAQAASPSSTVEDSRWNREWRTILLFLELYVFILRLTDDEDFFGGLGTSFGTNLPTSRLRESGLTLNELKRLSLFLKHLGFVLYYNAGELLESSSESAGLPRGIDGFLTRPKQSRSSQSRKHPVIGLVSGIDYDAFRGVIMTCLRMLYERDSRRPFLPAGHWLMTSKFDMEGFLSAVVLEEQRQHELSESKDSDDEDEEEDESDQSRDTDMDLSGGHRMLTITGQRQSRYARMEQLREQQKRAARERILAAINPKLEILRNMPFVIPFETRVQIFRQFVYLDKERRRGGNIDPDRWRMWVLSQQGNPFEPNHTGREIIGRHHAQIKRGQVFQDAFNQFYDLGDGLKEPIQITFVDQFDTVEAGIDGGGVTKEFLTSVTKEAFTDDQTLFVANNKSEFYPNPCALDQRAEWLRQAKVAEGSPEWRESMEDLLRQYEFLGRIIGKCMYEGILIDIAFARFFLLKWSSSGADTAYRANINDLREMDEELYQGMMTLKNYPGDVADLGLDFTITDQVSLPGEPVRTITRNLIPNGGEVAVTNENRLLYISYVARHRLAVQPAAQTRAFLRGLGAIIDPAWLSMFNQSELQRLVGGDSSEIDVEDLRANTVYSGVYAIGDDGQEHPTVKLFWEVMRSLRDSERREVLKYVTSTPRAPLLGFSQLTPRFSIRDGGTDQSRLPSASTCVNLLKLPQYRDAETLKNKLLYAVKSGAGFDLS